jgi:ABC-type phosphate transport system substrate-binding protein
VIRRLQLLMLSLIFVACASVAVATEFAVIVHPSNTAKTMSLADLGKILREKTMNWPNGRAITIVIRDPNSPAMKFVIEKAMGGTAEDGKAVLNEESRKSAATVIFVPTDEDIVKAVETNPTAIGIVDVYNITSGVKVIKIDDKQPFDPGYVLKGRLQ